MTEPRDKAGSEIAGTWSDGDLGESGSGPAAIGRRNRALGLAKTALGLPVPPPVAAAAPAPEPESLVIPSADDDPLESLFRADQTLRAPSIPAAPSEAEVTRWRATVRTSMFDENVSDPVPAADEPLRVPTAAPAPPPAVPPELDLAIDPRAASRARARAVGPLLGATGDPVRPPPAAGRIEMLQPSQLPVPPAAGRAPEVPPAVPGRRAATATSRSGTHSKTEPAAVAPSEPPPPALHAPDLTEREDSTPAPARRRRLQRGPRPVLLVLLALAALLVVGTVAVLIGLVANPFAPAQLRATVTPARPMVPPKAVPPPVLAKPAAPAPAPAQAAPSAQPAAGAQVAAAAAAAAPAAATAPAKSQPAAAPAEPAEPMLVVAPEELAAPAAAPKPAAATAAPSAPPRPARASAPDEPSAKPADAASAMTAARRFLADDEPARAEAMMRELLAQSPDDHHAMELLVRALMDQDRGQEAVPFARKMVQRRGKRVAYRLLLGDVLLMAGDEPGARAEWQQALELDPADREIKRRLGL